MKKLALFMATILLASSVSALANQQSKLILKLKAAGWGIAGVSAYASMVMPAAMVWGLKSDLKKKANIKGTGFTLGVFGIAAYCFHDAGKTCLKLSRENYLLSQK